MLGITPYVRIATAADLTFPDGTRVDTQAGYLGFHRMMLAAAGDVAKIWLCDLPVDAKIEHGRWIALCPNCQTGARTHPDWRMGCCGECGCVFRNVVFPPDADAIVAALLKRSVRANHNWLPPETLADILRENAEHEVA